MNHRGCNHTGLVLAQKTGRFQGPWCPYCEVSGMRRNFPSDRTQPLPFPSLSVSGHCKVTESQSISALEGVFVPLVQKTTLPRHHGWLRAPGPSCLELGSFHCHKGVSGLPRALSFKRTHEVLAPDPISPDTRCQLCQWTLLPPRAQLSLPGSTALEGHLALGLWSLLTSPHTQSTPPFPHCP